VMTGISSRRVLAGLRSRYEQSNTDPIGTRTLAGVKMMQDAGMPHSSALAFTRLQLGIRTSDEDLGQSPDPGAVDRTLAAAMGARVGSGRPPKGVQPPQLGAGSFAHQLIGGVYMVGNPLSFYDLPAAAYLARVASKYKLRGAGLDLFTNVDMRPDIVDLPRMEVFEIKPLGSQALAVGEMLDYVALLNGLLVDSAAGFKPGNPANPGTTGVLPYTDQGQDGVLVWGCPVPGAILYTVVNPMIESPENARARINEPPGLGLGVEGVVGLGLAGAGALAAIPEVVPAATVAAYEPLLATLSRAAQLAGQAIPKIVEQGAGLAK
jgi:hypothetical protein